MQYSDNGRKVTKGFESLEFEAYPDPASALGKALAKNKIPVQQYKRLNGWENLNGKPWTVGYGHTGLDVAPGVVIDEQEAIRLFEADIAECEELVNKMVSVPLTQGQYDCLVDMMFNMGPSFLTGTGLAEALKKGDYATVRTKIPQYRLAGGQVLKGLVRRRAADVALWDGKTGQQALDIGWNAA